MQDGPEDDVSETLDVLRRWFDAFEAGDVEEAGALYADDAVLHVKAPPSLAGDYKGFEALLGWYEAKRREAGSDFRWELHDLLANADHGVALIRMHSGGREWNQAAVYHVAAGQITEIWLIEDPAPA